MIIGLILVVALMTGLGLIMRRFSRENAGYELGHKNNQYWGMEEDKKE